MILAREYADGKMSRLETEGEVAYYQSEYSEGRKAWDARIVDENGREVWALDLAKRYLEETKPRSS